MQNRNRMITRNGRICCDICGRFVPYREYYIWTNYGGCQDLEPPDPQHSHVKCFESLPEDRKQLIIRTTWHKPFHQKWEL